MSSTKLKTCVKSVSENMIGDHGETFGNETTSRLKEFSRMSSSSVSLIISLFHSQNRKLFQSSLVAFRETMHSGVFSPPTPRLFLRQSGGAVVSPSVGLFLASVYGERFSKRPFHFSTRIVSPQKPTNTFRNFERCRERERDGGAHPADGLI